MLLGFIQKEKKRMRGTEVNWGLGFYTTQPTSVLMEKRQSRYKGAKDENPRAWGCAGRTRESRWAGKAVSEARCLDQVSGSFLPLARPGHHPIPTRNSSGRSYLTKGHFTFAWGDSYLAHSPRRVSCSLIGLDPVHIPQRGAPTSHSPAAQTHGASAMSALTHLVSPGAAVLPVRAGSRVVKAEAPSLRWWLGRRSRSSIPKPQT